jgi:hypothetical protein
LPKTLGAITKKKEFGGLPWPHPSRWTTARTRSNASGPASKRQLCPSRRHTSPLTQPRYREQRQDPSTSRACVVKTSFDHISSIEQSKRDVFITVISNILHFSMVLLRNVKTLHRVYCIGIGVLVSIFYTLLCSVC